MSLQRVLETARRTGTPVIVTDVAGREPLVVLPLEQFEALTGESKHVATEKGSARAEEVPLRIETLSVNLPTGEDLSLEERFYLEPIEDKSPEA